MKFAVCLSLTLLLCAGLSMGKKAKSNKCPTDLLVQAREGYDWATVTWYHSKVISKLEPSSAEAELDEDSKGSGDKFYEGKEEVSYTITPPRRSSYDDGKCKFDVEVRVPKCTIGPVNHTIPHTMNGTAILEDTVVNAGTEIYLLCDEAAGYYNANYSSDFLMCKYNDERDIDGISLASFTTNFTCEYCPASAGRTVCNNTDQCIATSYICDGFPDCEDEEDEMNCTIVCDGYQCFNSSSCVPDSYLCDFFRDCPYGDDEADCVDGCPYLCEGLTPETGGCIELSWVCDRAPDCPNGDDERNCTGNTCSPEQFQCDNGYCIFAGWECDGDNDCGDMSDEQNCTCDSFLCDETRCIPGSWLCDYEQDCEDGTDEIECPCEFECNDGACIPYTWVCDNWADCEGDAFEDEQCEICAAPLTNGTDLITPLTCSGPDGRCVLEEWICDGIPDCPDGDDEEEELCGQRCAVDEFMCLDRNHTCIPLSMRCDRSDDCADASDEDHCAILEQVDGEDVLLWRDVYADDVFRPVCSSEWQEEGNDDTCHYLGFGMATEDGSVRFSSLPRRLRSNGVVVWERREFPGEDGETEVMWSRTYRNQCPTNGRVLTLDCAFDAECGARDKRFSSRYERIVHGYEAQNGSWPWQVVLQLYGEHICGGSIISSEWVLTAAHCVEESVSNITSAFSVRMGSTYIYGGRVVNISEIIIHEGYDTLYAHDDIALVRLAEEISFDHLVQPVCLPENRDTRGPAREYSFASDSAIECFASGWGGIDPWANLFPEELREGRMYLIEDRVCANNPQIGESEWFVPQVMLCAGYEHGYIAACSGDSGGPLMCRDKDNIWTIAGVTSWGPADPFRCMGPSVYTEVSAYTEWIDRAIKGRISKRCGPRQFECSYGLCISDLFICDGDNDCGDWSDETHCEECSGVVCDGDKCVSDAALCNVWPDCDDGMDELNCTCDFQCNDGSCIPAHWVCDNWADCNGTAYEDEDCAICSDRNGTALAPFRCSGDDLRCLPDENICDGFQDCPEGDDEDDELCALICGSDEFRCRDRSCVPLNTRCDRVMDCADGSDEDMCAIMREMEDGTPVPMWLHPNSDTYRPICHSTWDDDGDDDMCEYMGFGEASDSGRIHVNNVPEADDGVVVMERTVSGGEESWRIRYRGSCPNNNRVLKLTCGFNAQCGARAPEFSDSYERIVNGYQARNGSWPWQVGVYHLYWFRCGGSLISDEWIATAAHCLTRGLDNPSEYYVRVGSIAQQAGRAIRVAEIKIHQSYDSKTRKNDVALLRLAEPASFNSVVRPVCLPEDRDHVFAADTALECYVTGWGSTHDSGRQRPYYLHEARMHLIEDSVCEANHMEYADRLSPSKTLCAGYEHGYITVCDADDGGPLVCRDKNNIWTLAGIVSWVPKDDEYPYHCQGYSVFAEVRTYVDWIHDQMEGDDADDACEEDELACDNGKCVPYLWVCDADNDCGDWSDERECENCWDYGIVCDDDNKCVPNEYLCDFHTDCEDLTDELDCDCEFTCNDGTCLQSNWLCDNWADCNGDEMEDEACELCTGFNSTENVTPLTCSGPNGRCILQEWLCDGIMDCPNGDDEAPEICSHVCAADQFMCRDASRTCIDLDRKCDRSVDCADGSDEDMCAILKEINGITVPMWLDVHATTWINATYMGEPVYRPLCRMLWDDSLNDDTCSYMGFGASLESGGIAASQVPESENGVVVVMRLVGVTEDGEEYSTWTRTYQDSCFDNTLLTLTCAFDERCGTRAPEFSDNYQRIVHGQDAQPGSWPWQISLQVSGYHRCGGSIVAPEWVATAAHCVAGDAYRPEIFSVVVGSVLKSEGTHVNVSQIIMHQRYSFKHDVALLRLATPLQFDSFVRPVCLPDSNRYSFTGHQALECVTTGWGGDTKFSLGALPEELQMTRMQLIADSVCKEDPRVGPYLSPTGMLCAGYAHGYVTNCQGDSGGPLMCRDKNNIWTLAGIVSWGPLSTSTEPDTYCQGITVYADVVSYAEWFKENMEAELPMTTDSPMTPRPPPDRPCGDSEVACYDRCVPDWWACDGWDDCEFGEDERCELCGLDDGEPFAPVVCSADGRCLLNDWICDGISDCESGEDEDPERCADKCDEGEFMCHEGTCISLDMRCDLSDDCPDASDEDSCMIVKNVTGAHVALWLDVQASTMMEPVYRPVCKDQWEDSGDDETCAMLGFGSSSNSGFINMDEVPESENGVVVIRRRRSGGQTTYTREYRNSCRNRNRALTLTCRFDEECGVRAPEHSGRIQRLIHGTAAENGSWPWQADLVTDGLAFCGGSIINNRWILTAAHCVEYNRDPESFTVHVGSAFLFAGQNVRVRRYIMHPDYEGDVSDDLSHDIALIELETDLDFSGPNVRPICLPEDEFVFDDENALECYVTGFGALDPYAVNYPFNLQQARMHLVGDSMCEVDPLIADIGIFEPEVMLCAGYDHGYVTVCNGDSGGPLACRNKQNIWTLAGVVSWSPFEGSQSCNGYSVFTEVTAYAEWIDGNMTEE